MRGPRLLCASGENVSASAWGVNAGVGAAYFFSRSARGRGGVRFNYPDSDDREPSSETEGGLSVGSMTFVAEPRFRLDPAQPCDARSWTSATRFTGIVS